MKFFKLLKFFKIKNRDKAIVIEVTFLLLFTRLLVVCLPYRMLRPLFGVPKQKAVNEEFDLRQVRAISRWINIIAPKLPFKCKCLPQAMAGKIMLKRRNIKSTLYLGLGNNGRLLGHAWLMVNDVTVTGGQGNEQLAQVACFS